MSWLRSVLSRPRSDLGLLVLAVLTMLPALWGTWASDDFNQRYIFQGRDFYGINLATDPLDVSRYYMGDAEHALRMIDQGIAPWWTYLGLKLAVWRPVTALSFWCDFHVLGDNVVLAHLHSLVWFAGVVALVAVIYRRWLPGPWLPALALLLFVLDDAHSMAVSWVSHRNTLLAMVFGLGCLLAHDIGRQRGAARWQWLAGLLFALALLSKEEGAATFGYLFAYSLCLDRGSWWVRAGVLVPYVVLGVAWRWVYGALGYGTYGLGTYMDPSDLGTFTAMIAVRAPVLLGGLLTFVPSDPFSVWGTTGTIVHLTIVVLLLAAIACAFAPLLRSNAVARFFALGAIVSLTPLCATLPSDRLLCFPGLGAMGIIAQFLGGRLDGATWLPPSRRWQFCAGGVAGLLILSHIVLAPLMLEVRTIGFAVTTRVLDRVIGQLPAPSRQPPPDQILITAPAVFLAGQAQYQAALAGRPLTYRVRMLTMKRVPVQVTRIDEQTFELRPRDAFVPPNPFLAFSRDAHHPMTAGETVTLTGMTVQVVEVSSRGWPTAAQFQFDVPLEDSSLSLLYWKGDEAGFVSFVPPPIGQTVTLSSAD